MSQPGNPSSKTEVSVNMVNVVRKRMDDLVIAWARDQSSGLLRYILELTEEERGKHCGCVCISCGQALTAVNAAKQEWNVRPHFRHHEGVERHSCVVLSARAALLATLQEVDLIVLPRRRRSVAVIGISGNTYEAWIEEPPEKVQIRNVNFEDNLTAFILLEDGRCLEVLVTGTTQAAPQDSVGVVPRIVISVDNPDLAKMSPEELRRRLVPLLEDGIWCGHWPNSELDAKKLEEAREMAIAALDWDDQAQNLPTDLRRESLLHREVKAILQSARELMLPGWEIVVNGTEGEVYFHSERPRRVAIQNATLEHRLGRIIPDVVARLADNSELLIEVTVTNQITDERLERIRQVNLPTLEIDFSRMGGVVSRERLRQLVLHDVVGKEWLHHPDMDLRHAELLRRVEGGIARQELVEDTVSGIYQLTDREWGQRYLQVVQRHAKLKWAEKPAEDEEHQEQVRQALRAVETAADALSVHGYPTALDSRLFDFGHTILERLLSVRLDTGVGYRFDNAWQVINTMLTDVTDTAKSWHGLYLMAINTYHPRMTTQQRAKVDGWRGKVVASIRQGEPTYLRDPRYDDLFALLFPEMAEGLIKPFGKRDASRIASAGRSTPSGPVELPATMFEEYKADRWIWAVTSSERVRMAEIEASRARLAGVSVEAGGILFHLVRSHHASEPWLHAAGVSRRTGLDLDHVLRYLYHHGYIKLTNQS